VTLNGALAQTIDMQRGYQVFLTPDGDTRGLYVASKSASSFVVREVQGGHGTFAFDYHVYASQLGSHAQQMTITQPNARAIQPQTPSNQPANMTTTR
jgi:hypothetical protein